MIPPLHEYQERGVQMLIEDIGGAGLGLDPGMGKTRIILEGYRRLEQQYPGLKMLLIAPIQPMYGTWRQEVAKWGFDFDVVIIHGTPKKRSQALQEDADVYIINPEGIKWLFDQNTIKKYGHPEWNLLAVDESTKFKKSDTARFKAIKKHLDTFFWRWIATGTIAPNGLEDLFGQIYITDKGAALGKYVTHFRRKYFVDIGGPAFPKWVPQPGAMEQVVHKIENRILLLKAADYLQMPDMIKVTREVTLPDDAREVYEQLAKDFYLELDDVDAIMAPNAAALGNKLRQIANGFAYSTAGISKMFHSEKLEALRDICEETNGHPLLIMYEFRADRIRLEHALGKDAVCITSLKPEELTDVLDRFNRGQIKYLLVHPQSVHGMNIQKSCHHIVWYSIIWNLEHYIQANTRLYRQGQSSPSVMVYHIAAADTIDSRVADALSGKDSTQRAIENAIRSKTDAKYIQKKAEARARTEASRADSSEAQG